MFSSLADVNRAIVACTRCPRLRAYCARVARERKREFRDWEYWGKPVPGVGELRLLRRVRVVVTLGRIAHEHWLKAAGWWATLPPRRRPAFAHGAVASLPDGTHVVSSYHPSRQNTNTGKLTRAMWHAVFRKTRRLLGA